MGREAIAKGRCRPSGFGMCRRLDGCARYAPRGTRAQPPRCRRTRRPLIRLRKRMNPGADGGAMQGRSVRRRRRWAPRHSVVVGWFMRSSTTTPSTSILTSILIRYLPGSPGTRAGHFISSPLRAPGRTASRAFSPRSPAGACDAAPSARWSTSRPRSNDTLASTTANLSR
jgi:hypothetical protein